MNLIQFLALAALFLAGLMIGSPLGRLVAFLPHGLVGLVCGVLAVLMLGWPLYQWLGWLPPPPKCPRHGCDHGEYALVAHQGDTTKWKCKRCGQTIMLEFGNLSILNDQGDAVGHLGLRWPKFLGRWRPSR